MVSRRTTPRATFARPAWELNPVIVKELRSRMRGARAFATLTGALILVGSFTYGLYRIVLVAAQYSMSPLSPQIGQALFAGLAYLELVIISAIAPSVTAGAISGEYEKQTYEMLLTTPLRPVSILWGKLVSALSYVFLLLFAAIPLSSLVFIFGGVTVREMVKALIVLIVVAVMFGVIGLFMSALFGRTGRASAVTYLVVLLMMFAPIFVSFAAGIINQGNSPRWMLAISPLSALGSSISPSVDPNNLQSMFWQLSGMISSVMGAPGISFTSIPRPLYHYSLPLYIGVTLVLYWFSVRLVQPTRRWRIPWGEVIVALVLLLGFAGMVALGFLSTSNRYEYYLGTATPAPTEVPRLWTP
jgi:ABC-2 type transport system permease protein